jgi:hypothetical protein
MSAAKIAIVAITPIIVRTHGSVGMTLQDRWRLRGRRPEIYSAATAARRHYSAMPRVLPAVRTEVRDQGPGGTKQWHLRRRKGPRYRGLNEQEKIRIAGLFAGRGDHGVRLSAMMSLMVEEMCHEKSAR